MVCVCVCTGAGASAGAGVQVQMQAARGALQLQHVQSAHRCVGVHRARFWGWGLWVTPPVGPAAF